LVAVSVHSLSKPPPLPIGETLGTGVAVEARIDRGHRAGVVEDVVVQGSGVLPSTLAEWSTVIAP